MRDIVWMALRLRAARLHCWLRGHDPQDAIYLAPTPSVPSLRCERCGQVKPLEVMGRDLERLARCFTETLAKAREFPSGLLNTNGNSNPPAQVFHFGGVFLFSVKE